MQLFEFLMILVSIIIGLGFAEILAGTARVVRARGQVRTYWLHSVLQLAIFLALFQQWWESWNLRALPGITYTQTCVLLASPVLLFLIAHLIYPETVQGSDLRDYYFRQAPVLWGLATAGTLLGTFVKPLAFGAPILQVDNASGFWTIPAFVVLMFTRRPRVHAALGGVLLVTLIVDTILAGYQLAE